MKKLILTSVLVMVGLGATAAMAEHRGHGGWGHHGHHGRGHHEHGGWHHRGHWWGPGIVFGAPLAGDIIVGAGYCHKVCKRYRNYNHCVRNCEVGYY